MKHLRSAFLVLATLLSTLVFLPSAFALDAELPADEYTAPFLEIAQEVFSEDDFIELTAVDFTGYVCVKFDATSISAKYTENSFYKGVVDYCRELYGSDGYSDLEYSLIYFEGHTSLRDSSGNTFVDKVISIDMDKEAVEKAAQDGTFAKNIPDIGENLWKHPALQ